MVLAKSPNRRVIDPEAHEKAIFIAVWSTINQIPLSRLGASFRDAINVSVISLGAGGPAFESV